MNKGFTLTEILGVVAILGLLFLIVVPSISNRIKTNEEKLTDLQQQMLKEGIDLYSQENEFSDNKYCIAIKTLMEEGYLNEDFEGLKNLNLKDKNILLIINNGKKEYEIPSNCTVNE